MGAALAEDRALIIGINSYPNLARSYARAGDLVGALEETIGASAYQIGVQSIYTYDRGRK